MKFQVKVGQEFPCYVAEDQFPSVTVNITQAQAGIPAAEVAPAAPKNKGFGGSLAVFLALLLIGLAIIPPMAFGVVTGDYSYLRSLAQVSGDLLRLGINLMKPI